MKFQYISYLWLLVISATVTFSLGIYAFIHQRHSKCAISFITSMLIVTIWSGGNAFEMSAVDFQTKFFFANIQYFAYCYSPLALLALCMRFTGYDKWLRNRHFVLLLFIPTISFILVWTDQYHGLMRYNIHMDYSGSFPVIAKNYGLFFNVHALYEHTVNIIAIALLISAVFYRKTVYRKQVVILLIGASFIVFPNIFFIMGLSPIRRFDFTPVFFAPAGMLMAWAIFRYKMFELVPIARATVIETMDTGVMVLDIQNRILDINPAFEKIMGIQAKQISARETNQVFVNTPEFAHACIETGSVHTEFSIKSGDELKIYEAVFSPLEDDKGIRIGRLAVVYEITEKKKEQQRRLAQERRLAAASEKERMARDLHDNLGQILGFINLQAQGIRQELSTQGVDMVNDKLDMLIGVTQSAHEEIRAYIKSSRDLSDYDFWESLRYHIMNFEKLSGIQTELTTNDECFDSNLQPKVQQHLLYIEKEALNNVWKHSEASHVKISLSIENQKLIFSIQDNGKGFTVPNETMISGKTFGLSILKERATEIGAELSVISSPGNGCQIILVLPVSQGGEEDVKTHVGG